MRWAWEHPQPAGVAVVVAAGLALGWWAVMRSDAFRVAAVSFAPPDLTFEVPKTVLGQRLWDVDVEALGRQLKTQRPSLKRVRVVRVLPNALQVESLARWPVAQVRAGQWFPVDAEGYVLPEGRATPYDHLVVLKGVDSPQAPLRAGHQQTGEALGTALRVLARLKRAPELVGHRVVSVDAGEAEQISFVMDENVEVRCGGEADLDRDLARLRDVLARVADHALSIRYIDVRFQDPVIAPRT